MRASVVIDKRTELALGLILVEHAIFYIASQESKEAMLAIDPLQHAQQLLRIQWEIASWRKAKE